MKLYEIEEAILECVDTETGEIIDIEKLEALSIERDAKIESICLWIKNLKAEEEALKAEKDAFDKRMKAVKNKKESLTNFISSYLAGMKFKTTKVYVSFGKSERLEVDDITKIPEKYLKHKEPDVDKTGLKKALNEGQAIEGVHIQECLNIQIK